jgi:hypothetical protein
VTVWYDDVQYTKRDWRNRNRLAGDAEAVWITIPVRSRGRFEQRICEVEIDSGHAWVRKHLGTFDRLYRRATHFSETRQVLAAALAREPRHLADLTIELNEAICRLLGLHAAFVRGSTLAVDPALRGQERILELCRLVDAGVYLSGPAGRDYLEPGAFAERGVELRYMVYDYAPYDRGGQPFVPGLSVLDPLAWIGREATRRLLTAPRGAAEAVSAP